MAEKKNKPPTWKIGEILSKFKEELLPDYEYQRGKIWKDWQKCLLIDSVLRGYQIPMFYFRKTDNKRDDEFRKVYYHIVDGHQRIDTLRTFFLSGEMDENLALPLYDPKGNSKHGDFPDSLQEEVAWAGIKSYEDLPEEKLKEYFDGAEIPVEVMECTQNEARDLFIRMQGGAALERQEIRDAMPGHFCRLVRQIGGVRRQEGPRKEGHKFFRLAKQPRQRDRGEVRMIVAQSLMLFLEQRKHGRNFFRSTNGESLDKYYQEKISFPLNDPEVKRFNTILDKLYSLLHKKCSNLSGADIIHLVLFVDALKDDSSGVPQWERGLSRALLQFKQEIATIQAKFKKFQKEGRPAIMTENDDSEIWNYVHKSKSGGDKPAHIRARHEIYVRRMRGLLGERT